MTKVPGFKKYKRASSCRDHWSGYQKPKKCRATKYYYCCCWTI